MKSDEENSKHASLAHERKGFWLSIIAQFVMAGVRKALQTLCTCEKECNKLDLTATQCFLISPWYDSHRTDLSRWFAISSPPPICYLIMSGVAKKQKTKLGCEKYFCRITY